MTLFMLFAYACLGVGVGLGWWLRATRPVKLRMLAEYPRRIVVYSDAFAEDSPRGKRTNPPTT